MAPGTPAISVARHGGDLSDRRDPAESLFTAATYVEELGPKALIPYGGTSLHEQSHGEAFLAVMVNRFGPDGLYILDEPEAALSTQNCLTFLRRVHELLGQARSS